MHKQTRSTIHTLAFLLGLGLALALLVGLRLPLLRCEPLIPGAPLLFDEKDYIRAANAFAVGSNASDLNEAWMRAPATSWLLLTTAQQRGVPVELAGCDFQRLQTGMWALLLLLVAWIAAQLFDRRSALICALLLALLPVGLAVTLMVHADTLFALLFVTTAALLLQHARSGRPIWALAAGVAAGCAALTRSPIMPLLPLLALWASGRIIPALRRRWRGLPVGAAARLLLPGALFLICTAAVLTPWTLRNYRLYGGFIPSDTTGAATLFDNNAPRRNVNYTAIRESSDNPVERQSYAMRQAWAVISADPARFARKFASTALLAWSPEEFLVTQRFLITLLEAPRAGALLAQLTVLLWLTIPLVLLGLLFAPHTAPGAAGYRAVVIAMALVYTLITGATHFEERYRLPFLLLLLPFAGWCLAHPRALALQLRRPAGLAACALVLLLACAYVPLLWPHQWDSARALALHGRGLLRAASDPAAAADDQRAALAAMPGLVEARVALADALARQGDRAAAEQELRATLEQANADKQRAPADAVVALQRLLRDDGRTGEVQALDRLLSLPARRRAEDLAWGQTVPSPELRLGEDDQGLVRGFYNADEAEGRSFRWSGSQAQALLTGPGDQLCLYVNAARSPALAAPSVALAAQFESGPRAELGHVRPPRSGWAWLCAPLPRQAGEGGRVTVELQANSFNPFALGQSADARDLGLAVSRIALRSGPLALDPQSGLLLDRPAANAEAGPGFALIGASAGAGGQPGQTLPITLWWRGEALPPPGTFSFIHLLDAGGQTVASYSAPLAADQRPSPPSADEPLLDPAGLALPADLAPGRYRLRAGAFDPASGARLAQAELGELTVETP
ncbi:MAG TPA: glycosyltransferase family 39 protein [Roseiflexaceae bacterium]|nr:glycosyltransferase family 39 protein [Roseiflexaceae bacterium]